MPCRAARTEEHLRSAAAMSSAALPFDFSRRTFAFVGLETSQASISLLGQAAGHWLRSASESSSQRLQ